MQKVCVGVCQAANPHQKTFSGQRRVSNFLRGRPQKPHHYPCQTATDEGKDAHVKSYLTFLKNLILSTTMQLNLETLKSNGQQHIDQIIESEKETIWSELAALKFQDRPSEELEVIKTLWSYGFMRGAETATRISMELYELLNSQKKS
jgi:hypothetical protein